MLLIFFVKSAVKNLKKKIQKTVLHAHDFEIFVQELFPSMLFLLLESRNVFKKFFFYLLSRYGMRYMAKVLKAALEKKFPEAAEKDVLKVNGNDFSLILLAFS